MSPQNCNQNVIFYCNRIVTYLLLLVKPFPKNFFGNFSRMCPVIYCGFPYVLRKILSVSALLTGRPRLQCPPSATPRLHRIGYGLFPFCYHFPSPGFKKAVPGRARHSLFIKFSFVGNYSSPNIFSRRVSFSKRFLAVSSLRANSSLARSGKDRVRAE